MSQTLLTLVFLPLVATFVVLCLPSKAARWLALGFSLAGLVVAGCLWSEFDSSQAGFQLAVSYPWVQRFNVNLAFAIDGLSFPLVVLTKFMMPIAILASWKETRRVPLFMACFLFLDFAMTGTFLATDIFLFYVFWEAMLIPMLLIIGIWGSAERIYASIKFFLYTFAGSLLMLVGIIWLFLAHYQQVGSYSADIATFYRLTFSPETVCWGLTIRDWIFLAFTLAFAIKVPLFPLHTWLPDAHVQAPTGGSILLAAVLLKMGTYGLLRFSIPLAPQSFALFAPGLAVLSLIGIIYGAWVAYQQTDVKKLVAYSSVSHMGFVVLGLAATNGEGWNGAVLQMVNHGLATGALFFLVGALYERRHSRNFADFGGLAEVMPWYAFFLVFVSAASMAVPGLNGFVGEFLILFGTYKANHVWALVAVTGVVFGAVYTLIMIRKILFGGNISSENRTLKDLDVREWLCLVPLCLLMLWIGLRPGTLMHTFEKSLGYSLEQATKAETRSNAAVPSEESGS